MDYLFPPPPPPSLPIQGDTRRFPVSRIFCVGRNYAAHAREMGDEPGRQPPFYFAKSATALAQASQPIQYPPGTIDLHHEIELVVALGSHACEVAEANALKAVFGYAVGLDMTRRDLQNFARGRRQPWTLGKDFESAAVVGEIVPASACGHPSAGAIELSINGSVRQRGDLSQLIWDVPAIIAHLSRYYRLRNGDLIFTGTPAGVGPVHIGDALHGCIEGIGQIRTTIVASRTT